MTWVILFLAAIAAMIVLWGLRKRARKRYDSAMEAYQNAMKPKDKSVSPDAPQPEALATQPTALDAVSAEPAARSRRRAKPAEDAFEAAADADGPRGPGGTKAGPPLEEPRLPWILMFPMWQVRTVYSGLALIAAISMYNTSTINPDGGQYAQLERKFFCKGIPDNRNVALPGECGRQSVIVMPGWQFSLGINVLNDISYHNMLDVAEFHYARLTARDGLRLDDGQVAAKPWKLGMQEYTLADGRKIKGDMLDATFFLTEGHGQAGPQTTILLPKRYAYNTFLWDVEVDRVADVEAAGTKVTVKKLTENLVRTKIEPGFVGVVRSAIDEDFVPGFMPNSGAQATCRHATGDKVKEEVKIDTPAGAQSTTTQPVSQIKAELVPVGCRGVWKDAVPAGDYFINKRIYDITLVDTRVQNWTFQGGYKRRYINLTIEDDGTIKQEPKEDPVEAEKGKAGTAVAVKVEGWTVYQDVRIQARALPEHAALMVAAVGGLQEVEDRIIVPQVYSVLRDIGGSRVEVSNTEAYEEAKSEVAALKARLEVLKDLNADVGLSAEQRASEIASLEKQVSGIRMPDPNQKIRRPTRVLDFQNEREALQKLSAKDIQLIGQASGLEIVTVTFGNADIPAELLVSRKIEQLSGQLRNAYLQKRIAQVQRQAAESAKARADKQGDLVEADIRVQTSKLRIVQRTNEGQAERKYLEEQALGQRAQTDVLGQDRVAMLQALQYVLGTLEKKPELLTGLHFPGVMSIGSGFDINAAAAIFKGAYSTPPSVAATPQR